jgi:lipopolysaccharide export system ATP-binding protein
VTTGPDRNDGRSLIASGLTKAFKGRTVVERVDLQLRPGEVVGLLGPNGAGKTTTFKLILGLLRQDAGTVTFGERLDGLPLHRRARLGLGYLPQGPSIFRRLVVRDNLLVLLESLGCADPAARAAQLLSRFSLTDLAGQRASTLSGGERRRLEFARALCSNPAILLSDEPFSGVDPIAAAGVTSAIRDLAGSGVGVLLTDHTVREALLACDRVYLIVDGRIVETGTPEEIRASETAKRLYLGQDFAG